jgi:hypothetical protein
MKTMSSKRLHLLSYIPMAAGILVSIASVLLSADGARSGQSISLINLHALLIGGCGVAFLANLRHRQPPESSAWIHLEAQLALKPGDARSGSRSTRPESRI